MRVNRAQLVNGITAYIQREVLPKMDDDRSLQIMFTVAVNAIKANDRLLDKWLGNEIVKAMLDDDGSGSYDITRAMESIRAAVEEYGAFPIAVPPIPLVSPREITIKLDAADINAIKKRIESAGE